MVYRYTHRTGDYKVRCDVSGFLVNASDCRMQWDGKYVHKDFWSPRHPQDRLAHTRETLDPPIPRPEGTDEFVGATEVTASDL